MHEILFKTDLQTCLALGAFDAAKSFLRTKEQRDAALEKAATSGRLQEMKLLEKLGVGMVPGLISSVVRAALEHKRNLQLLARLVVVLEYLEHDCWQMPHLNDEVCILEDGPVDLCGWLLEGQSSRLGDFLALAAQSGAVENLAYLLDNGRKQLTDDIVNRSVQAAIRGDSLRAFKLILDKWPNGYWCTWRE